MRASARRRGSFGAACFATLVALTARAPAAAAGESQGARSIRIDYDAPSGCPDEKSFEAQIRARSAKIVVASDGATSVRVRVAPHAGRFEGEVALVNPKGRESRRHVEGGCTDVAAALALITALALDPTASTASDPAVLATASGAAAPSASSAAPPSPPPSPPPPTAVTGAASKPAEAPTASADSEPLREEEARTHTWGWAIGAEAGLTEGVAPNLLVSVPAFLEVWRRSSGAFAPAIRVRFEHADSGTVAVGGAGADFTWTAGSLDLCPVAWPWSPSRLRISACVRGEGGTLSATGADVSPVRSDTRPWVTVGLVVRARITVVGALFLDLEGGGFVPLVRDRFFVEPDATIQQVPILAAAGAGGVGVTFW